METKIDKGVSWERLFPHAATKRPMQEYLWNLKSQKGFYIVVDTPASGKTEAALGLAYHLLESGQGINLFYASAHHTSSTSVFERVREFAKNGGIASEVIRTSNVERIYNYTRDFHNSIIIVDEVIPYELGHERSSLRSWIQSLRSNDNTLIILSSCLTEINVATMTQKWPKLTPTYVGFVGDSYISFTNIEKPSSAKRKISIDVDELGPFEIAELAFSRAKLGQKVLIIESAPSSALSLYDELETHNIEYECGIPLMCLTSEDAPSAYSRTEKKFLKCFGRGDGRPNCGCVMVVSQAAQEGVDIDADFIISDIAPMDILMQRAAKLWRQDLPAEKRHCDKAEMVVHCFCPGAHVHKDLNVEDFLKSLTQHASVKWNPYIILRTLDVLGEWSSMMNDLSPDASLSHLIERTYEAREYPKEWGVKKLKDEWEKS